MLWPGNDGFLHVAVRDPDDISPALSSCDDSGPTLKASMWHTLLLGAIKHDCDPVAILVSMHDSANEEPPAISLVLPQNAASSST